MEISRLYNKEYKFLYLIGIIFLGAIVLITTSLFFLMKNGTSSFEKNLTELNYGELYKTIEKQDFSEEIFKAYMNYNFGSSIEILEKFKSGRNINFKIKGVRENKTIKTTYLDKSYKWNFDDYVYDWKLSLPEGAKLFIQGQEIKAEKGMAFIERIPFAVYEVRATMDGCKEYRENVMAGQEFFIKLEPSASIIDKCTKYLGEYFNFKERIINEGKVTELGFVDRESGVYGEVIDEADLIRSEDVKVVKKLVNFQLDKIFFDESMNINLDVIENWNVDITNQGQTSSNIESSKKSYIFTFKEPVKLIQIKTIK